MKKIVLFLFFIVFYSYLFAQEQAKPATQAPASDQTAKPAKAAVTHKVVIKNYCCPSCDYVSTKQGSCPHHQKALIRDGMYYCEDGTTSREPGKCKDGMDMKKMTDKSSNRKEINTTPAKEPAKEPEAK